MKALILCAGKGTRLGLKKTPKTMVKVNGKPILEHLVNQLNKAGITEIIVNIHKDYDKIFKYFGTRLLYFYEPVLMGEKGTEAALQDWLGREYIVMNGDTLTDVDIQRMVDIGQDLCMSVALFKERYGGTKFCYRWVPSYRWDGDGAQYFDCGTKAKLAKARRYYAKH